MFSICRLKILIFYFNNCDLCLQIVCTFFYVILLEKEMNLMWVDNLKIVFWINSNLSKYFYSLKDLKEKNVNIVSTNNYELNNLYIIVLTKYLI